jgi:hypothetical protein
MKASSIREGFMTIDTKLSDAIAACVANEVAELRALAPLLLARLPELAKALEIPGQPCDTEFMTTGYGHNAAQNGFETAYADAHAKAQTICNTGACRTLTFKRYVEAATPGSKWTLKIAWECRS